jgi:hypothetical protein
MSQLAKKIAQLFGARAGGDFVPQYFFVIQGSDQEGNRPPAVAFPNDAAALRHAERIIAELQKERKYVDPMGFVIVRNERNETILSVPFLPACA